MSNRMMEPPRGDVLKVLWGLGLLGVMGVWVQGVPAGSPNLLGSPLRVAQCRAKCVHTFSKKSEAGYACVKKTNCNTCWDQCQKLGEGWSSLCDQDTSCEGGCREACHFHLQQEVQRSPVLVTRGEEVITLSRDDHLTSWPPPGAPNPPHIFVLMCRLADDSWTEVTQTLELSYRIPKSLECRTVRVMVVGLEGLVTVYSPASSSRPLQDANLILQSVGNDLWPSILDNSHPDSQHLSAVSSGSGEQESGWRLREVSLIHQGVLVIAEIAWESQTVMQATVYLVTWEVDGGGLRGNLLTDSTSVTLSLWPDAVYRIQVQLVREPGRLSEPLVLDTHQAPPLLSVPQVVVPRGHPGFEAVAGMAAALLLFLALLLLASSRKLSSEPRSCKEVEDLRASNYFKLFPPPVRLLLEPGASPESVTKIPDNCEKAAPDSGIIV